MTSSTPNTPTVVVGIDVGSESTKITLGSTLDYEIVRNAHGGHTTPSSVTFRGKQRLIGEDATEAKNADANTVLHIARLLMGHDGGNGNSNAGDDASLSAFYRFSRTQDDDDDGTHAVSVEYDSATRNFSSSAVLAMLLGKVRRGVEETVSRKTGGGSGLGAARYVLAVPPGTTDAARAAVRDAAFAAGCGHDVAIVSAAACTAAVYGKKFGADADADAGRAGAGRVVLIVDMGHAETSVSILRLGGGSGGDEDEASSPATLLASASNAALGGGCADVKLWHHFQSTVPGLASIQPNTRRGQRLLDGCRRLKHLLSMLPSGSVTVETLGDNDMDVTLNGSRDLLQQLCKGQGEALSALVAKVVADADGVESAADIVSVETLGGGVRIPFFQEAILQSLGREDMTFSRSLDDTSVAMGAALLGEGNAELGSGNDLPLDEDKRKALADAEDAMRSVDIEMHARSEARNKIESHVLEMRGARHGKHGSLLPEELDAHLTETDDWLFTEECDDADLAKMEAKLADVLAKTTDMCAAYYEAVKKEAAEKEAEMKAEEEKAKAERDAAGEEDDDHDTRKLPFSRRMEIVQKNKAEANELFSHKNFRHAAARYVKALSHCAKFFDLTPDQDEEVKAVKLSLNLNLALAYVKLENFPNALRAANEALAIDENSTKALFRRSSIYYEQKKFDEAKKDISKALKAAPEDAACKKLSARIDQQLKRQKDKQKKMAKKMFG